MLLLPRPSLLTTFRQCARFSLPATPMTSGAASKRYKHSESTNLTPPVESFPTPNSTSTPPVASDEGDKWIKPSLQVSQFLKSMKPPTPTSSTPSSSSRHPWMCADHPMLLDDFHELPPFMPPSLLHKPTPVASTPSPLPFIPSSPVMNKHKLRKLRKRTRSQRK